MPAKLMKPERKLDNPFSAEFTDCDYGLEARSPSRITGTRSGLKLERNLRIALLERQVKNFARQMAQLISFIDTEDLLAAKRLKSISPSTKQLSAWAQKSVPPKDLADKEDNWT